MLLDAMLVVQGALTFAASLGSLKGLGYRNA